MKYWIFLILIGLSFSVCTNINVSDFINQTVNISNSCYTIFDNNTNNSITINAPIPKYTTVINVNPMQTVVDTDTNITCKGNDVRQNLTSTIMPNAHLTDPVTNNTFICSSDSLNLINQTINCGETYTSSTRNVSITARPQSFSLVNRTLIEGDSYSSIDRNVFITVPRRNIILSPVWGTNATDTQSNVSCNPISPNVSMNLTYFPDNYTLGHISIFGPQKSNVTYNLTVNNTNITDPSGVKCNYIPQTIANFSRNVDTNVTIEGIFRDNICNITVRGPSMSSLMLNEKIVAEYGKNKTSSKYNVSCIGPDKFNGTIILTDNTSSSSYYDEKSGFNATCTYNTSSIPACYAQPIDVQALYRLNANDSGCMQRANVCIDMFSNVCTAEEALGTRNNSLYSCLGRIKTDFDGQLAQKDLQLQNQINITEMYKNPANTYAQTLHDGIIIIIIIAIVVLCAGSGIVYVAMHGRTTKLATKPQLPKKPLPEVD